MKTILTEVLFRDVPVGRVISQAVLTRTVGAPFDYRPGYSMVAHPADNGLSRIIHKIDIARTKRKKSVEALVGKTVLGPERRQELEHRLRMMEREYVQRVLATIQEFECIGGDQKYGTKGSLGSTEHLGDGMKL